MQGGNGALSVPSYGYCWNSTQWVPCPASSGGGGDASAANQTTQIAAEQAIQAAIGAATASPSANTIGDRLKTLNTTLGSPFQAGGSIGNTAFGISGTLPAFAATPTVNLGTLNGAATAANQATEIASLASIDTKLTAPLVVQTTARANAWRYAAASGGIVNSTTAVTIKAAAGAGNYNALSTLTIDADGFASDSELVIRDGAAGTVMFRSKIKAGVTFIREIRFEPPLIGSANTLLEVATLTAGGASSWVLVNASGSVVQ